MADEKKVTEVTAAPAEKKEVKTEAKAVKASPKKAAAKKTAVKAEDKKEAEVKPYVTRPAIIKDYSILKYIIVTEETQKLQKNENAMVFAVDKKATKTEIKAAVQAIFAAKVKSVNTEQKTGKTKRVGRFTGKLPDYKRAIIRFDSSFDLGKIQAAVATDDRKANKEEPAKDAK
jgi:large subunit ribosomal protein L23